MCENVTVADAAADRLGPHCAPLVCTAGYPTNAVQSSAGRTPHPTEDGCGHSTGQTYQVVEDTGRSEKLRFTGTPGRRGGLPDSTHHPRPRPLGPQPSRAHY